MNGGNSCGSSITPNQDPLSVGTAYLYSQLARGELTPYEYNNATGRRKADAGELQAALWWLEDEIGTDSAYMVNGDCNKFYMLVTTMFGVGGAKGG